MKKAVLIDLRIECAPPTGYYYYAGLTLEKQAKRLEEWAKDFNDFIRDHRSQDKVSLSVERIFQDQCSFCGSEWEIDNDGVPMCCQDAIKEMEIKNETITMA